MFGNLPNPIPTNLIPTKAPDSGDIVDKTNQFGDLLAGRPETFWALAITAVIAFIIVMLLKNPVVKGAVIGCIILLVVAIALGIL